MPRKGELTSRAGEKHITNEGYEVEIIEYFGNKDCAIRFNDGITLHNRQYIDIVKGRIKNPYHKSVCGIGYFGVGKYSGKTHSKIYQTWAGMLERCYDKKCQQRQPTYKECIVSERWHNFQNFAKWHEESYNPKTMQGWHLDKDILKKGNKIYSPKTCCFIPNEINILFTKSNSIRGKYPIGVTKVGHKFRAELNINSKSIHLGVFNTPEEAFQAYKTAKETHIKWVAKKYKSVITEPTYQALINYEVEITD